MARDTESPGRRGRELLVTRPTHSCLRRSPQKPWGRGCDRDTWNRGGQGLLLLRVRPPDCAPSAAPPWSPRSCQGGPYPSPWGISHLCGESPLPWPHPGFPISRFSAHSLSQETISVN